MTGSLPARGLRGAACRCHSGFTLLEMIVVVTLIAILTGAIVPIYRGSMETVRTEHGIRDLVALLKYGQERAVTDSTEYRLYLNPEDNEYWLARFDGFDNEGLAVFETVTENIGGNIGIGGRIRLSSRVDMLPPTAYRAPNPDDERKDVYYLTMYATGASDLGKIVLVMRDRRRFEIELTGPTGRMKVTER